MIEYCIVYKSTLTLFFVSFHSKIVIKIDIKLLVIHNIHVNLMGVTIVSSVCVGIVYIFNYKTYKCQ